MDQLTRNPDERGLGNILKELELIRDMLLLHSKDAVKYNERTAFEQLRTAMRGVDEASEAVELALEEWLS